MLAIALGSYHFVSAQHFNVYLLMSYLSSSLLLGLGISIPLLFLAILLGWVQLLLLITGKIEPHMTEKGLSNILTLLLDTLSKLNLKNIF